MKIAFFISEADYLGGADEHMLRQARLMQQEAIECIVVLPDTEGDISDYLVVKRCKMYGLKFHMLPYRAVPDFDAVDVEYALQHYERICRFLQEQEIDLVHYVQLNVAVEMAVRFLKIPGIMSIYSIPEQTFRLGYADIISGQMHTDSYWCIDLWKRYNQLRSYCIRGYCEQHEDRRIPSSTIEVVLVANLVEFKNQLAAIEMIDKLKAKGEDIHLTICGLYKENNYYYQRCRQYIKDHQLEDCITWKGFVADIYEVLSKVDVFLCTSTRDSFPQSIAEALSIGLPVVTTPVAGVPEVIKDGYNGFVSDDYSSVSILEAFERYLKYVGNGKIGQMKVNIRETFNRECSYEAVKKRLFEMYNDVLHNWQVKPELYQRMNEINQSMERCFVDTVAESGIMQYVRKRKFYAYYIHQYLMNKYGDRTIKTVVWGAGIGGQKALEMVKCYWKQMEIMYIIDEFKAGDFFGYTIHKKEYLLEQPVELVIVATEPGKSYAMKWLEEYHYEYNDGYIVVI